MWHPAAGPLFKLGLCIVIIAEGTEEQCFLLPLHQQARRPKLFVDMHVTAEA
jgi:hypothetical protein